jgi:hypothetical protein
MLITETLDWCDKVNKFSLLCLANSLTEFIFRIPYRPHVTLELMLSATSDSIAQALSSRAKNSRISDKKFDINQPPNVAGAGL